MSTLYQSSKDVPTEVLATRLNELADVVAQKRDRIGDEFTMRIPAECDRDADLVMSEAARRLSAAPAVQGEPVAFCEDAALSIAERTFSTEVDEQLASDIIQYAQRMHSLYTAPQPAERQPDVTQLVEALETTAEKLKLVMETAQYIQHTIDKALAPAREALAAHRKQGGEI